MHVIVCILQLAAWRWGSPTGGEGDTGAPEEPTEAERATASESIATEAEAVVSKGAEEEAGAEEWEVCLPLACSIPNAVGK